MSTDDLTPPERCAARKEARSIKRQLELRASGLAKNSACWACVNRAGGFGKVQACGLAPPREFPGCLDAARGFEVDSAVLYAEIRDTDRYGR